MKNKINKILLIISSVLVVSILFLAILGSIERIGYLSEFKLNKSLSKKNAYFYDFRIKYYSKIFRNSDLYNVDFQIPKSEYINGKIVSFKNINFNEKGSSPFANFVSSQQLKHDYKINGIKYTLKLKFQIYIIFMAALLYILYFLYCKFVLNINLFNNEKLLLKIHKIICFLIIVFLVFLVFFGKIKHKAVLGDLELLAYTESGYVYKARIANNGLFSPNIVYNSFDKLLTFKNKPEYIKNGYSLELHKPDWYNGKVASVYSNSDGTFTISNNSPGYIISYQYDLELSKGEKYILTLEAKKVDTNIDISDTIKYHFNKIYNIEIKNTDKMIDEYKKYVSELNIQRDDLNKLGIRFYFPKGVFNLKSIKIEQLSDNLYLKSGNTIVFTSSKKIDDIRSIDTIYYTLHPQYKLYIFTLIFIILSIIFIYYKRIDSFIKENNTNNNIIYLNNKNIINIPFIIYLIFISLYLLSTGYLTLFGVDEWHYSTYSNAFYQIFDFGRYFWQRGRQFTDIFSGLYVKPIASFFISFGADPIIASKVSASIVGTIYYYILFIASSLYVWIFNNRKNYKLIFVIISLFIIWQHHYLNNIVNIGAYIASGGIALLIFFPMIYYFVYKKEIILIPNKELYYSIYFFFIYVATFTIEPTSLFVAGLSFFILLKMIYDRFISNTNEKLNIYIFVSLIFYILFAIVAFINTTFFSGRGQMQFERLDQKSSLFENVNSYFIDKITIVERYIFIIGVVLLLFFIIYSIKNKKMPNNNIYIYMSILLVSIIGIIGFSSILVIKLWLEMLSIFMIILLILLKYGGRKNFASLLINLVIINFIIFMSFDVLIRYNKFFSYNVNKKIEINLVNMFKEAEKEGLNEIVLSNDDIKNNNFSFLKNDMIRKRIVRYMYYYRYTTKLINVKIVD